MSPQTKVFGKELEELVNHQGRVPPALEYLLSYLEMNALDVRGLLQKNEKIYFLEKSRVAKKALLKDPIFKERVMIMKKIKKRLNTSHEANHEIQICKDPYAIAGLLKVFLLQLPNPLLTYEFFYKFVNAQRQPSTIRKIVSMRSLYVCLPPAHGACLQRLLQFLRRILEDQHVVNNHATIESLSAALSPICLRPKFNVLDHNTHKSEKELSIGVIGTMLNYYEDIFLNSNEDHVEELELLIPSLQSQLEDMEKMNQTLESLLHKQRKEKNQRIVELFTNKKLEKRIFFQWKKHILFKSTEQRIHFPIAQDVPFRPIALNTTEISIQERHLQKILSSKDYKDSVELEKKNQHSSYGIQNDEKELYKIAQLQCHDKKLFSGWVKDKKKSFNMNINNQQYAGKAPDTSNYSRLINSLISPKGFQHTYQVKMEYS